MFGEVLGFQLAEGLKQGAEALREAARGAAGITGAYLRNEAPLLVRPEEFRAFREEVERLDEALGRLEARLRKAGDGSA